MSIEGGVAAGVTKLAGVAGKGGGYGHGKAAAQGGADNGFAAVLLGLGMAEPVSPVRAEDGAERGGAEAAVLATTGAADPSMADPSQAATAWAQTQTQTQTQAQTPIQTQLKAQTSTGDVLDRAALPPVVVPGRAVPNQETPGRGTGARLIDSPAVDPDAAQLLAGATAPAAPATADVTRQADSGAAFQPLLRQAALVQRMAQGAQMAQQIDDEAATRQQRELRVEAASLQVPVAESTRLDKDAALLLAAAAGETGLSVKDRRQDKENARVTLVGENGGWSGLVQQPPNARVDVPLVAPDPNLMTQTRVAEQVSYWIGRGVQNAELQVDGLGAGPVKVSIAVQGQEARVDFSVDHAHARQMLEDSMPQLRDLLAREGMVLSGMSVGGSGADGAGARSPQDRPGSRQGVVAVPEVTADEPVGHGRARAGDLTGRSVDLFV